MRKLLLLLTLPLLLTSCVTRTVTVPAKPVSCPVPPAPVKPAIDAQMCGEMVCLTVADAVALARYQLLVDEREWALRACTTLKVTP